MKIKEKVKTVYRRAEAKKQATEKQLRKGGKKAKFSRKKLVDEIMFEAKVLGRHMGSAIIIAEEVADEVENWANKRAFITEEDITRVASKKLEKYDKDLAYIYKNRDTII